MLLTSHLSALGAASNNDIEKVVHSYNSVALLLNINPNIPDNCVVAEGLQSTGDGGGGVLRYYPTDTTATNESTVFKPYNYTGRWWMIVGPGTNAPAGGGALWTNNAGSLEPFPAVTTVTVPALTSTGSGSFGGSGQSVFTNGVNLLSVSTVTGNLGAALAGGSTTYIDTSVASATNIATSSLTFSYATNGVDLIEKTHVRWIFNGSGSDQTLTLPAWRTNVSSAVPPKLTNATITKLILSAGGPTDTAARQTNCYVRFEYYK